MENKILGSSKFGTHTHIFYLRADGTGDSSKNAGHTHKVMYVDAVEPQVDEQTGEMISAGSPAKWEMEPSGNKNHVHTLENIKVDEQEEEGEDDEDKVIRCKRLFENAKTLECDSRDDAEESERFYDSSGQWEDDAIAKLDSEGRAHVSINEIKPTVDLLSGFQRRNRNDIIYRPREGGDQFVADTYTELYKYDLVKPQILNEQSLAFEDCMIAGRGLLHLYIDKSDDINGEIKLERFPWKNCYFGPHTKLDLSDCDYLTKVKWVTLSWLKAKFPKKAEKFIAELNAAEENKGTQYAGDDYLKGKQGTSVELSGSQMINIANKEFKLLEVWEKEYEDVRVFSNPNDDYYIQAEITKYMSDADLESLLSIEGFEEVTVKMTKMKVTTSAGGVFLTERYSAFDDFTIIPIYANKRENRFWGKVEDAKEMQREVNKRHSQLIDFMNKAISTGYFFDKESFPDLKSKMRAQKNMSKPGFMQEINDVSRPPIPSTSPQFPTPLITMEQLSSDKMMRLMNINPALAGQDQGRESGFIFARKQLAALMGNEYLFDNFSLALRKVGRLYLRALRITRTPEDMVRILGSVAQGNVQANVGGIPLRQLEDAHKEELLTRLQTAQNEKYDVVADESKSTPTKRMANLQILLEMQQSGGNVPQELIIEFMDIDPEIKAKWQMLLQQQAQAAAQQQGQTAQMEITKTAIANPEGAAAILGGGGGQQAPMQ